MPSQHQQRGPETSSDSSAPGENAGANKNEWVVYETLIMTEHIHVHKYTVGKSWKYDKWS